MTTSKGATESPSSVRRAHVSPVGRSACRRPARVRGGGGEMRVAAMGEPFDQLEVGGRADGGRWRRPAGIVREDGGLVIRRQFIQARLQAVLVGGVLSG